MAYAHGKIILIGEHAVVHHTPAIVLPVFDAYVEVHIESSEVDYIDSSFFKGLIIDIPDTYQAIQMLIIKLKHDLMIHQVKITMDTHIPVAAGMGASAAIASAITQAMFQFTKKPLSQKTLKTYMNFSEVMAHGSPSGIDVEGVLSQKPLIFQKEKAPKTITTTFNGYLFIVFSGIKGSTKEAVLKVQSYLDVHGNKIIQDMEANINQTIEAFQNKDIKRIGPLLKRYQAYLNTLGVSHKILDDMIKDAYDFGSLGAKLSGGGLGGCMIALFDDQNKMLQLKEHYNSKGYQPSFVVDLSETDHDDLR
jgi:mevalonate kinase